MLTACLLMGWNSISFQKRSLKGNKFDANVNNKCCSVFDVKWIALSLPYKVINVSSVHKTTHTFVKKWTNTSCEPYNPSCLAVLCLSRYIKGGGMVALWYHCHVTSTGSRVQCPGKAQPFVEFGCPEQDYLWRKPVQIPGTTCPWDAQPKTRSKPYQRAIKRPGERSD